MSIHANLPFLSSLASTITESIPRGSYINAFDFSFSVTLPTRINRWITKCEDGTPITTSYLTRKPSKAIVTLDYSDESPNYCLATDRVLLARYLESEVPTEDLESTLDRVQEKVEKHLQNPSHCILKKIGKIVQSCLNATRGTFSDPTYSLSIVFTDSIGISRTLFLENE